MADPMEPASHFNFNDEHVDQHFQAIEAYLKSLSPWVITHEWKSLDPNGYVFLAIKKGHIYYGEEDDS